MTSIRANDGPSSFLITGDSHTDVLQDDSGSGLKPTVSLDSPRTEADADAAKWLWLNSQATAQTGITSLSDTTAQSESDATSSRAPGSILASDSSGLNAAVNLSLSPVTIGSLGSAAPNTQLADLATTTKDANTETNSPTGSEILSAPDISVSQPPPPTALAGTTTFAAANPTLHVSGDEAATAGEQGGINGFSPEAPTPISDPAPIFDNEEESDKPAGALAAPTSAGLHINLVADANNVNAPAGWSAAIQQAASIIEQNFSDPVTVNLRYGYGSFRNVVDPTLTGSSGAYANSDAGTTGNYSTVAGWLLGDRTTTDDFNSYNALPATSASFPGGANNFYVPNGELRALGQLGNNATIDGSAAFGTSISLSNLVPVALHELTHALGRLTLHYTPSSAPVIADWFRFDATGHFQWTEGSSSASPSYFSIDNGATHIADFGRTSDYSDYLNSGVQGGIDPFNEFYSSSTLHSLTTADLQELDVIGFNRVDDFVQNNTTTGAVSVNSSATGNLNPAGDQDWFRVTLTAGTHYRFNENGSPTGGGTLTDTLLRLYDGSSNLLTSNDDSYTVNADSPTFIHDSQFFYTPSSSGTYYLSAEAFSTNAGTYTVHVTVDDFASDANTTASVAVNGSTTGNVEASGDRDWFAVTLTAGTHYRFNENGSPTGAGTLTDTYLRLYDSATHLAASNDDSYTVNADTPTFIHDSQLFYTPSASGTYYLSAGAFSTNTGTYSLSATTDDYASDFGTAGAVAVSSSATGKIDTAGDRDWFSVTLTAGHYYQLDLQGSGSGQGTLANPFLRLYNAGGTVVASNDDNAASGLDSRMIYRATSTGTYYLSAASSGSGTGTYRASVNPWVPRDFNSDFKADIVLQNSTSGQAWLWEMNSNVINGGGNIGTPDAGWQVRGVGDLNGDGTADVVLQNSDSGQAYLWAMNGNSITAGGTIATPDAGWKIRGIGDFNGDGKADITLQNQATQQVWVWLMDGNTITGGGNVRTPDTGWQVVATGDINGDGKADIVMQNQDSGQVWAWEMNGNSIIGGGNILTPDPGWKVITTGDFNGDTKADLVWQNSDTGEVGVTELNGNTPTGFDAIGFPDPGWQVRQAADLSGHGSTDILLQNAVSGQTWVWGMTGTTITGGGNLATPDPGWKIPLT